MASTEFSKPIDDEIKKLNNNIQHGRVLSNAMTSYVIGDQTFRYKYVTFDKPFSTAPTITTTMWNGNMQAFGWVGTFVADISTTGFNVGINVDVNTAAVGVDWIAVGN